MQKIIFMVFIVTLTGCTSLTHRPYAREAHVLTFCEGFAQGQKDYWNVLTGKEKESEKIWRDSNEKYRDSPVRNIAIFIDGTGNTSNSNTNVWKLYSLAVAQSCDSPVIPFYHKGVGTKAFRRILGGGIGSGVDKLIRDGYRFLVETYQPGDRISIFGFSRGAYAARSLNGMVEFVGLLNYSELKPAERQDKQLQTTVKRLYKLYSQFNDGKYRFEERLRKSIAESDLVSKLPVYGKESSKVVVNAIGVFDTVPALGLGRDDFPDNHRTDLYAGKGFHALSIDEQRNDFRPLFFSENLGGEQTLDKVWFAGAHADIGGGYNDHYGLEMLPRLWMRRQFKSEGLFSSQFDSMDNCSIPDAICESGTLHDEFLAKKFFGKFGLHWRLIAEEETLHTSVVCRTRVESLPHPHPGREPNGKYQPENLLTSPEEMQSTGLLSCE